MTMNKKFYLIIYLIISCSIQIIGQTDYYYYKGKKIPLTLNENKVVVSIRKDNKKACERIHANVKVLNTIKDETFDIYIITRSDYEKLTSLDFWKENSRSILLTPTYITTEKKEVYSTPYLNIRLKKEQDIDILASYAKKYGLNIVKQELLMPLWYIVAITPESQIYTLECANILWESGLFAASVPDMCSNDLTCSNDPMYNQQWGLQNNEYTAIDISASSAWNYSTGKNVKIAIIDSGVDLNQIDLASNISSLSYDTETNTSPSIYYRDHATHCAGIAAAVKDNGIQIAGVAPEATIISISNPMVVSANTPINLAKGIVWAYQNGADIISNSWHYPTRHNVFDEAIQDAFTYGRHGKGCIIAFAAGNLGNDSINYPANCNDTILAVGAIHNDGTRASFSNYGTELDLVAPGVNILSTLPNNSAGYKNGTSMACPHVAGVAALILERNSELTVSQVNSIINSNAKKIAGISFNVTKPDGLWNNEYGYGLVDAYSSVINTPSTAYIQNETITGSRIISAGSIYVGTDVTDTKPHGDVILGQGDITVNAEYVVIKNSTTVPLGTTLIIGHN